MEASALRAPAGLTRRPISLPLLRLRSDDQLLALFRAGSDAAFDVIHDRYRQRLFAYVRQMLSTGPRAEAEDVLQDVFVRAYGALRADERAVNLRAWLYRVAHNRCIDYLRRPAPPAEEVFQMSRTPLQDPIETAERRDDLKRLVEDVGRLPEQQRSALLMREIDGMAYSDIGEALEVSVAAVKSLLVRARMGLVEAIQARDTDCAVIREDLVRWSENLLRELDQTVKVARGAVPEIEARKPLLQERIRAFATAEPGGVRIRQHGDLHLGQVLRSEGHWLIFDFEGEPARTLEERRAKHTPFKDVAGMLRSLAYAAGAVEVEGGPSQRERLAQAREEFLRGWRGAAGKLVPSDERRADVMLRALELEKLLYEIRYEVGHRPDWVRIPARDLFSETER